MAGLEEVSTRAVGPYILQRTLGKGQTGEWRARRGEEEEDFGGGAGGVAEKPISPIMGGAVRCLRVGGGGGGYAI